MRAIIVDDEALAIEELKSSLAVVAPNITIVGVAHSVAQAVDVISQTPHDLLFMDISLGDGKSFEIFDKTQILSPVIFITAYDSYTLQAFKNQGVDYILKPFGYDELAAAISKLLLLQGGAAGGSGDNGGANVSGVGYSAGVADGSDDSAGAVIESTAETSPQERFMVTVGNRIRSVKVDEVAYFMAEGKYLYLYTFDNGAYIIDNTISNIMPRLSSDNFFQINRKFIISFESIAEMYRHSHNRIKISLDPKPKDSEDVVVSTDRVVAFRRWLNK